MWKSCSLSCEKLRKIASFDSLSWRERESEIARRASQRKWKGIRAIERYSAHRGGVLFTIERDRGGGGWGGVYSQLKSLTRRPRVHRVYERRWESEIRSLEGAVEEDLITTNCCESESILKDDKFWDHFYWNERLPTSAQWLCPPPFKDTEFLADLIVGGPIQLNWYLFSSWFNSSSWFDSAEATYQLRN